MTFSSFPGSGLVVTLPTNQTSPLSDDDLIKRVQDKWGKTDTQRRGIEAVVRVARTKGIDPLVALSLAKQESNFKYDVVVNDPSERGEPGTSYGLFNLRQPGQGSGYGVNELLDPYRNAEIFLSKHVSLFSSLVTQYQGSTLAKIFGKQAEQSAGDGSAYGKQYDELLKGIGGLWSWLPGQKPPDEDGETPQPWPWNPGGVEGAIADAIVKGLSGVGEKVIQGLAADSAKWAFLAAGGILVVAGLFGLAQPAVNEAAKTSHTIAVARKVVTKNPLA